LQKSLKCYKKQVTMNRRAFLKSSSLALGGALLAFGGSQNSVLAAATPSIPSAHGVQYLDVVTLSWLAYKGNFRFGRWRSVTGKVWRTVTRYQRGPLHAVLVEGDKRILAFSGTDEPLDWADNIMQAVIGLSGQYLNALDIARNSGCEIVVGHSLGGGLASFAAIHTGKRCATVNPAPLALTPANREQIARRGHLVVNYVVSGEILEIIDALLPNMSSVGAKINVPSRGRSPIAKHYLSNLIGFAPPTYLGT